MKTITYARYLFDYLKHGDLVSVIASVKYVLNRKSHGKDRTIRTSTGLFFCRKNTTDFQFANFYYEWPVKRIFLRGMADYQVFIDGGSCIGIYSVLMAKAGMKCIAFEPASSNFEVLTRNLDLNKVSDRVRAFPYGLGESSMTTDFYFNPVNTGASHVVTDHSLAVESVRIRSFDSLFPELGITPDQNVLFKLDVEGMEEQALRGAKEFLGNHPHMTLVIENAHTSVEIIKEVLNSIARFEFGTVDELNMIAKKIG